MTTPATDEQIAELEELLEGPQFVGSLLPAILARLRAAEAKAACLEAEGGLSDLLFQSGDFVLSSGQTSRWKIECDALSSADWRGLAAIAADILPPFGSVEGVPRGGVPFADALAEYSTEGPLLIAEDVVTTGESMERHRAGREAIGVTAFARGPCPAWVTPLFSLATEAEAERIRADERERLMGLAKSATVVLGDRGVITIGFETSTVSGDVIPLSAGEVIPLSEWIAAQGDPNANK